MPSIATDRTADGQQATASGCPSIATPPDRVTASMQQQHWTLSGSRARISRKLASCMQGEGAMWSEWGEVSVTYLMTCCFSGRFRSSYADAALASGRRAAVTRPRPSRSCGTVS